MSQIQVDTIVDKAGTGSPAFTYGLEVPVGYGITGAGGINVSGVVTCGSLAGSATGLTGTPDITVNNITGVAATFTGALPYDDVTNVDSLGIVTARGGFEIGASGVGGTITAVGNAEFTGIVTATSYYGDGSTLTNAGVTVGKAMGLAAFLS